MSPARGRRGCSRYVAGTRFAPALIASGMLLAAAEGCARRTRIPPPRRPLIATAQAALAPPPGPARGPALQIRLVRHRLRNGLQVLLCRQASDGLIALTFATSATPLYARGAPHFAAWLIQGQSGRRWATPILVESMWKRGFAPVANATPDGLTITERIAADDLEAWVAALDEALNASARPLSRLWATAIEGARRQDPVGDTLRRLLYAPADPRAASHRERWAQLARQTQLGPAFEQTLVDRYRQLRNPARAAILVVGDISPRRALPVLGRRFSAWTPDSTAASAIPPRRRASHPQGAVLSTAEGGAVSLRMGDHAPGFSHRDYPAFLALMQLLGRMQTAQINRELRRESQLGHGIVAAYHRSSREGRFELSTVVKGDDIPRVSAIIDAGLRRLQRRIEVREALVAATRAREQILAELDTTHGLARAMAERVLVGARPAAFKEVLRALDRLTPRALEAAARRWLRPGRTPVALAVPDGP